MEVYALRSKGEPPLAGEENQTDRQETKLNTKLPLQ